MVGAGPMMEEIRRKFRAAQYEYSLHAVDQSILRRITRREVEDHHPVRAGPFRVGRFQEAEAAMKCEVCGVGERRERLIRYSLALEDGFVVVEHVPASVCEHCGETSFAPEVVERLQATIWESRPPVRRIETPVYEFA